PLTEVRFPQTLVHAHRNTAELTEHGRRGARPVQVGADRDLRVMLGDNAGRPLRLFQSELGKFAVQVSLHPAGTVVIGFAVPPQHQTIETHVSASCWSSPLCCTTPSSSTRGQSFQSRSNS